MVKFAGRLSGITVVLFLFVGMILIGESI